MGNDFDQVRRHALAYLLSNIGTHYKHYDPSKFNNVAFIPAIQSSRSSLQAPKDVGLVLLFIRPFIS